MRASGEGDGAEGFHEVEEGEGRAHEDEGFVCGEVVVEGLEVEFIATDEEAFAGAIVEVSKHMAERGLRGFFG